MPKIHELPAHVADLIAAGEVVEKPASVIKELMENSIDAGAGMITVEIEAGGMTYMRVTDNGCGIAPGDAGTAFLRHATSKLSGAEGLESIGTLGFRGEALAAIAAVSRIGLLTRETGADEGVSLTLEGGTVTDTSPAGCPEGTTIIVRDLFFNTPARLKFMKSDRAEGSSAASAALRCALSHPGVSVRFIKDGKTEFHTPGDFRADSCVYSLFGREFFAGMLPVQAQDEKVSVTGFVSSPEAARGNRNYQFFFVNGRHIRSKILQAALERAYANSLPGGRYPSCVLYIATKPGDVDVNVHPAKTEIKFVSDKPVFDGVYYAALGALTSKADQSAPETAFSGREISHAFTESASVPDMPRAAAFHGGTGSPADEYRNAFSPGTFKTKIPADNERGVYMPVRDEAVGTYQTRFIQESAAPPAEADAGLSPQSADVPRVIGETLDTYILAEYSGSVWIIDKHAAHERIHFDALCSGAHEPMSQALITPVICRHGHEGSAVLLENAEFLDRLGFTVESFGDDAVAVRRIPAEIDIDGAESALSEIAAALSRGGTPEPARLDGIYKTVACKAAIKAGRASDTRELEELAGRVISGEIARCPHGRPVAFEMTKKDLDKRFGRL